MPRRGYYQSQFPRGVRFELKDLESAIFCFLGVEPDFTRGGKTTITSTKASIYPICQLADILGHCREEVSRWTETGLTHEKADELACHVDLPTVLVWPNYYDQFRAEARLRPHQRERTDGPDRRTNRRPALAAVSDASARSDGDTVDVASDAA